jgi:hypothetical protein
VVNRVNYVTSYESHNHLYSNALLLGKKEKSVKKGWRSNNNAEELLPCQALHYYSVDPGVHVKIDLVAGLIVRGRDTSLSFVASGGLANARAPTPQNSALWHPLWRRNH